MAVRRESCPGSIRRRVENSSQCESIPRSLLPARPGRSTKRVSWIPADSVAPPQTAESCEGHASRQKNLRVPRHWTEHDGRSRQLDPEMKDPDRARAQFECEVAGNMR